MKTFAVISGNVVTNFIADETLEDAQIAGEVVEIDPMKSNGFGWIYDKEANTFTEPELFIAEETE